jgi:hypothetical protein
MRLNDLLPLSILIALAFPACANLDEARLPSPSPTCPARTALVVVGDGYLQTGCGCAEASPVYTTAGQNLVCTVAAGTLVQFHYLGTTLRHQIAASGSPGFPASPISDPIDPVTVTRVHAVRLDTPGTYSFRDLMNAALTGDLIVL